MTPEQQIKSAIMAYLNALPGMYARQIQVRGMRGRTSTSKGVLDIIGSYKGKAVAIEVKTAKGQLEASQEEFIAGWTGRGRGIAIVARSVDDVIKGLETAA